MAALMSVVALAIDALLPALDVIGIAIGTENWELALCFLDRFQTLQEENPWSMSDLQSSWQRV
jgi:hypothetical protein